MSELQATESVTVDNPFGTAIAVIDPGVVAEIADAIELLGELDQPIAIDDDEALDRASAAYKGAKKLAAGLEKDRKARQKPVRDLVAAWNKVVRSVSDPLVDHVKAVERRIADVTEARRKEAARIEREAREAEQAAEKAKRDAERKADEARAVGDRKAAEKARAEAQKAEVVAAKAAVERRQVTAAAPSTKGSSVKVTTYHELVIDDVDEIPVAVSGRRLLVPDEKAIRDALKAGEFVPGCRLVEKTRTSGTGR